MQRSLQAGAAVHQAPVGKDRCGVQVAGQEGHDGRDDARVALQLGHIFVGDARHLLKRVKLVIVRARPAP